MACLFFPSLSNFFATILPCEHACHFVICTRAHMHARLTWDPREDLTHSEHVGEHLLWVLQFSHMPYHMDFGVPRVYMSQYWQLGTLSQFSCAPRVEVLKMVFLCFEPKVLLIKGLKALGCFRAIAQSPSPLGTGGKFLGVITFVMTNPLLGHNGPQHNLHSFQPGGCVRLVSRVKGNLESVREPAWNRLCRQVSLPPDGRSMGDPIWGILLLAIFGLPFFG